MFSLFQNIVLFSIHWIVFKQFPFVHLEKSVSKFWVGKLYWNDNGNFEKTYICNCIEKLWVPPARPGQADWCWLSLHIHHIQLKVQSSLKPESEKHHFPTPRFLAGGNLCRSIITALELISVYIDNRYLKSCQHISQLTLSPGGLAAMSGRSGVV